LKNHTSIYVNYFGYSGNEFIPCECCGGKAVDIHHIVARGIGGVKENRLDLIENLQAVCRNCHNKYGDKPNELEFLVKKHAERLNMGFDKLWKTIKGL